MKKNKKSAATVQGDVFLNTGAQQSLTSTQIELLRAVAECGSITNAAKKVGISYKTAWDRVDAINNLSKQPLMVRATGGSKGGGTQLTEFGQKILTGFDALTKEHQAFLKRIGHELNSFNDITHFIRGGTMVSTARNQYRGKVKKIEKGAVNAEVEVAINETQSIIAHVSLDSLKQLGLKRHQDVIALINASWIILTTDTNAATSARNKLVGTVDRIVTGAVNSEVIVDLGSGKSICATVTNTSVSELKLKKGLKVAAIFKAPNVILMTD